MRYTDYKQVKELAKSILTEDKRMITLVVELRHSLMQLNTTFLDDGYDKVRVYVDGLIQRLSDAQEAILVLAKELEEYARILELGKGTQSNTIGNGGYTSPYEKTAFSGMITYIDPKTKQTVDKLSNRTVYENKNIDPAMVIPAGTPYPNGKCVRKDTTNLELMEQGKAPFVLVKEPDGSNRLAQVELHHVSGEETQHGSMFFQGVERDGTMVEIASTVHDKFDYQLHIGNPSFRRDEDGKKSEDAAKYEKFREEYWKQRAKKIRDMQNNNRV